jgi:hypothetical protein
MEKLRRLFDRLLNGPIPDDPLYVSNRTTAQKVRTMALVLIPCALLIGLLGLALSGGLRTESANRQASSSQQTSASLNVSSHLELPSNSGLEVMEVRIVHAASPSLAGKVRNNTGRILKDATVDFDLIDGTRTRLGAVRASLKSVAPHSIAEFDVPIEQHTAVAALVRDIHFD